MRASTCSIVVTAEAIPLLVSIRLTLKLTVRTVAARMPGHLGWDPKTLVKIEIGRRNISFVEALRACSHSRDQFQTS
jgi:hypothetical protein